MKNIFTQGEFKNYRKENLAEAYEPIKIRDSSKFVESKVTVFISHKHDELNDIKDVIGFLEKNYNVKCYIDSKDKTMPKFTSPETAEKIKHRIKQCDKFILLATNGAINSEWCNWELGYGDAFKFNKNIAIFPFQDKDMKFDGNEYLDIYPYIVERTARDKYSNGTPIVPGYYVRVLENDGHYTITELSKWFES